MPSYGKPFSFFFMKVSIINIGDELLQGKTLNDPIKRKTTRPTKKLIEKK